AKRLNKKPGDRVVATLINYQDDFGNMLQGEVDVLAEFPLDGRLDQLAIIHIDYLTRAMDAYRSQTGRPHPMMGKMINLVWARLPSREAYAELSKKLETGRYSSPAVKMETASSGFGSWFDAYRDLIWGMKWLMGPAIIAVMALVISNAISISVRERRTEM